MKTYENLIKEIETLRKQVVARDKLLEEANNKLKIFYPGEPIPDEKNTPVNCKIKTRRGSWYFVDIHGKRVKTGENMKQLKTVINRR